MYNVAAVMNDSVAVAEIKKLQAAMEADTVVGKLMDAAESVEDMYEVAKRYIQIKFEDFCQVFNETMDYLKGSKVELDDGTMECVVGGFSWRGLWNGVKKVAIAAAIGVAVVTVSAVTAGAAGAVIGAAAATIASTSVTTGALTGMGLCGIGGILLSTRKMYEGASKA